MKDDLLKCLSVLQNGGLILYPTDTVWGIGCDATNTEAIEKIYALKGKLKIMTVPILISTFSEYFNVFFITPLLISEHMGGIKSFSSSYINHFSL